ncbi:TPA: hypothetical protein ACJHLO_004141, partial [Salmonella enterica]
RQHVKIAFFIRIINLMQEAKLHNNIPLKRHLVSKGCSYPLTFQFSVVGKIQDYAELERLFLRLNELI